MKLSCLFPSVIQKGIAHVKSAGMVSTGMKRQCRSFNDNPKCAERQAVLRKRLCEYDGAPFWVEPVACRVLSRYSYGVDAQQLVAADLDSRMRRNSRISGVNVNEELRPSSSCEKVEERRNICRQKNPFNDLILVCREDGVCCVVASLLNFALFNLIVVINKHSLKVFPHTATLKSLHCLSFWSVSTWGCPAHVFETEQVLPESRGEFLVSARVVDILQ